MALKVKALKIDGVEIIDINGRITSGDPRDTLRLTIRSLFDNGARRFVINLGGVDFMDTSGLNELIYTKALLTKEGGDVNLVGVNRKVKDLLVMTKLFVVFDCFDDETAAIAAVRRPTQAITA